MNINSTKCNMFTLKRYATPFITFLMATTLSWMIYEDFAHGRWAAQQLANPDPGTEMFKSRASDSRTEESNPDSRSHQESKIQEALRLIDIQLEKDRLDMEQESRSTGQEVPWNTKDPVRVLLVTTWRSGSTFLGRIFSNHSAAFNWYEPLIHFEHQISDGPQAERAVQELRSLLHCRFPSEYMQFLQPFTFDMLSHNAPIWDPCQKVDPTLSTCRSLEFLHSSCNRFPVQVMKLVRFRMRLTEELLSDPTLPGLKIIYLVRDPRAVISSRRHLDWCRKLDDCINPQKLCGFMQDDFESYERLARNYKDRIMLIKYEDMAMDPVEKIRKLFHFSGLQFTERLENIVRERTSKDDPAIPWGTMKVARTKVDSWRKTLNQNETALVEQECLSVMRKLQYFPVFDAKEHAHVSNISR